MLRSAFVVGLLTLPAMGQSSDPIRVVAQVPRGPFYVGQAVTLQVNAIAEGERPQVVPPKLDDADVSFIDTELKPITTSAIGNLVMEKIRYVTRFRLVPRRAGTLVIPAVSARLGERSGTSRPLRVTIQNVPAAGRPADFLGGVGTFDVEAKAVPATIRAGQSFEYRIGVTGLGALGMTHAPALKRFDRVPLGLDIAQEPDETVGNPPSRVFRFRIRATRAGTAVLPPVAIAAFDPKTTLYVTKATPGVPLRVVDVPRYDPSSLDYRPQVSNELSWVRFLTLGLVGVAGILVVATTWVAIRRTIARRQPEWALRRLLSRIAARLDRREGTDEIARLITEGLAAYLNLTAGRPLGALTPDEARQGVAQVTRDDDVGDRAGQLVTACDRALYSGSGYTADDLIDGATRLLEDLRRWTGGGAGGSEDPETPREAVETAPS